MEKILVALDPGASGGIAWTKPGQGVVAVPMPADFLGIERIAREIGAAAAFGAETVSDPLPVVLYVEKVTGYVAPQKSKGGEEDEERENRQPGHAMFTFGKWTGAGEMAFRMIGAKVVEVPAKEWQKPLFVRKGQAKKEEWKRTLKNIAQRKFPTLKVTLKTADSLLILFYAGCREGAGAVSTPGNVSAAVAGPKRPESGRVSPPAPVPAEPGNVGTLALVDWKGVPWVARVGVKTETLVRKATAEDLQALRRVKREV